MLTVIVAKEYQERASLRHKAAHDRTLEELPEDTEPRELLARAGSAALFDGDQAYLIRGAFGGESADELLSIAKDLANSTHLFLFEEESIAAPTLTKLGKVGVVLKGSKATGDTAPSFNTFALADALGKRDRRNLWMLIAKAQRFGIEPEEIVGVLHWQTRTMLAAASAKTAADANLKEFVFTKSKRYAANFTQTELRALSRKLFVIYHDGHRGFDLALLIERFALSL